MNKSNGYLAILSAVDLMTIGITATPVLAGEVMTIITTITSIVKRMAMTTATPTT
jgi:hypothetical protein